MNNKIETILENCNRRIEHLKSTGLRADALLKLIQIELSNIKQPNLIQSTQAGFMEMIDAIEKTELIIDLDFSIQLLTTYIENHSLVIVLPLNTYSKDMSDRFMSIRNIIENIINSTR